MCWQARAGAQPPWTPSAVRCGGGGEGEELALSCAGLRARGAEGGSGDGEGFFKFFWSKESCIRAEQTFWCGEIQRLNLLGAMSCTKPQTWQRSRSLIQSVAHWGLTDVLRVLFPTLTLASAGSEVA